MRLFSGTHCDLGIVALTNITREKHSPYSGCEDEEWTGGLIKVSTKELRTLYSELNLAPVLLSLYLFGVNLQMRE